MKLSAGALLDSSFLIGRLADGGRGAEGREIFRGGATAGAMLVPPPPPAAEPLVGGRLGGGDPCAVLGLEPRRLVPGWGGKGRPEKGFTPGGPGRGRGNGFDRSRAGST